MAFTLTNNSPQAGYIAWSNLHIVHQGVDYTITNGSSNAKFIFWDKSVSTTALQVSNTFPTLDIDDLLVFVNKSGTGVVVPTMSWVEGDLVVPGSILTDHIAANAITTSKLKAGSVTTEKLVVGAISDSINLNPNFEDGTSGWSVTNGANWSVVTPSAAVTGAKAAQVVSTADDAIFTDWLPIDDDRTFVMEVWRRRTVGDGKWSFIAQYQNVSGTTILNGTDPDYHKPVDTEEPADTNWALKQFRLGANSSFTFPAGAVKLRYLIRAPKAATVSTTYQFQGAQLRSAQIGAYISPNAIVGEHIVGNTITGDKILANEILGTHILAGEINTNHMAANTINGDRITANSLSATKISAGTLSANVLLSGNIRTADTGQRAIIDSTGIRLYNSAGSLITDFNASAGTFALTATGAGAVSWTAVAGTWGIASNQATQQVNDTDGRAILNSGISDGVFQVGIKLSPVADRANAGVIFRSNSAGTVLLLAELVKVGTGPNDHIRLLKRASDGTYTQLATLNSAGLVASGDYTLTVIASGSTIEIYINKAFKLQYTLTASEQTTYGSQTYAGLRSPRAAGGDDGGSLWDNFSVTGLAGSGIADNFNRDDASTLGSTTSSANLVLNKDGILLKDAAGSNSLRLAGTSGTGVFSGVVDGGIIRGSSVTTVNDSGKTISLDTLAFGLQAASVTAVGGTSSQAFVDLPSSVGPSATVTVGPSGRLIVWMTSGMMAEGSPNNVSTSAEVGFEISGATTRGLEISEVLSAWVHGEGSSFPQRVGNCTVVTGLNPGVHTVKLKYRTLNPNGTNVFFGNRTLVVQPF